MWVLVFATKEPRTRGVLTFFGHIARRSSISKGSLFVLGCYDSSPYISSPKYWGVQRPNGLVSPEVNPAKWCVVALMGRSSRLHSSGNRSQPCSEEETPCMPYHSRSTVSPSDVGFAYYDTSPHSPSPKSWGVQRPIGLFFPEVIPADWCVDTLRGEDSRPSWSYNGFQPCANEETPCMLFHLPSTVPASDVVPSRTDATLIKALPMDCLLSTQFPLTWQFFRQCMTGGFTLLWFLDVSALHLTADLGLKTELVLNHEPLCGRRFLLCMTCMMCWFKPHKPACDVPSFEGFHSDPIVGVLWSQDNFSTPAYFELFCSCYFTNLTSWLDPTKVYPQMREDFEPLSTNLNSADCTPSKGTCCPLPPL